MGENNTHAVTLPNKPPAMPIEVFRNDLSKNYKNAIINYFDGDKAAAMKFMSALAFSVQKNPKLLDADRQSLFQAGMSCAEFQLYPSNVAGEAFLIPYKGRVQFQLGYQGLVTLLARNGISTNSQIVRKNDRFEFEEGLEPKLIHSYDPFATDEKRGEPIGAYAVLTNSLGQKVAKVMGTEAVMKIKDLSQAKASEYSPWNSKQDPELWMWRKTCIKQAAKLVPKTEVLQRAIAKDNEDSVIRKDGLDAEGPAVGAALHGPVAPEATLPPPVASQKPYCPECGEEDCWSTRDGAHCVSCGSIKPPITDPVDKKGITPQSTNDQGDGTVIDANA